MVTQTLTFLYAGIVGSVMTAGRPGDAHAGVLTGYRVLLLVGPAGYGG